MSEFGMRDESVKVLCKILESKSDLYRLDLTCNKIGLSNISYLTSLLTVNHSISELILNSNNITSNALTNLLSVLSSTSHIISLSFCNSTSLQKNVFNFKEVSNIDVLFNKCYTLKVLNLNNVKIADVGVNVMARYFHQSFITYLNIGHCLLTDNSSGDIA